jgi:hypothetical protein
MGFKRMENSLGFADLALATSLKHNSSLVLISSLWHTQFSKMG